MATKDETAYLDQLVDRWQQEAATVNESQHCAHMTPSQKRNTQVVLQECAAELAIWLDAGKPCGDNEG